MCFVLCRTSPSESNRGHCKSTGLRLSLHASSTTAGGRAAHSAVARAWAVTIALICRTQNYFCMFPLHLLKQDMNNLTHDPNNPHPNKSDRLDCGSKGLAAPPRTSRRTHGALNEPRARSSVVRRIAIKATAPAFELRAHRIRRRRFLIINACWAWPGW